MLQDSVARYAAESAPLERVRRYAEGADDGSEMWSALVDMGVLGAAVPERAGGLGLGLLDAALVQEQLGAGVVPVDHLPHAVVAQALVRTGASDALAKMLAGEVRYALALSHAVQQREGAGVRAQGDGALEGSSLFAQGLRGAERILTADDQGRLWVVRTSDAEIRMHESIDKTRPLGEVRFQSAPAELIDPSGEALGDLVHVARVLLAADTLGAVQHMLDAAVAYSLEREQFGRVIGSFQAVKHLCAEMAAQIEPARSLMWYAAYAFDHLPDEFALCACHAKAHLDEVGRFVARTATEVHGGMGFTDLLGLHYWFKRIGANRQLLGGPELVREDAALLQDW